jgi:photosystem II biogenesis protein Psp29
MNQTVTENKAVSNIRTVSDTKRAFYSYHARPINSVYRRVVEEIMVEMHLLSVNSDFKYDPIYALGVVSSFERLMQGYQPEKDKESIFNAICRSIDQDPDFYRSQAESLLSVAESKSVDELVSWLNNPEGDESLVAPIKAISQNDNFKYSRLFGIGIYTLIEKADPELLKDKEKSNQVFVTIAKNLSLPEEKMRKDLELYRSNLDKMDQLLKVMADMLEASRKQREKRALEKKEREAAKQEETVEKKEETTDQTADS